jgi:hypothetical protein
MEGYFKQILATRKVQVGILEKAVSDLEVAAFRADDRRFTALVHILRLYARVARRTHEESGTMSTTLNLVDVLEIDREEVGSIAQAVWDAFGSSFGQKRLWGYFMSVLA